MGTVLMILLLFLFAFIMSDFDIHLGPDRLYVDRTNEKVMYRAVGKGIKGSSFERLPMMKLKRVNKYMFVEEGLVGAKYLYDDVVPMSEEFFDEGRGICGS